MYSITGPGDQFPGKLDARGVLTSMSPVPLIPLGGDDGSSVDIPGLDVLGWCFPSTACDRRTVMIGPT
jgi:hypothetical protein